MKNIFIVCFVLLVTASSAQIGINNPTPASNAELDISSTTRGFLMPRLTQAQRLLIPATTGMFVYQTNTVGANVPGIYSYVLGWANTTSGAAGWPLFGRTGVNPNINYLGTQDAQPFLFKTNNAETMRILADGKVGVGTITPLNSLHIANATPGAIRIVDGYEGVGNILTSSVDGTTTWRNPASVGLANWNVVGNAGSVSTSSFLGTTDLQDFVFKTNNSEQMRVQADGNIRINSGPTLSQLQVNSSSGSGIPTIRGVNTNTSPGISLGVYGDTKTTTFGSYAVSGYCFDVNGTSGIGVIGQTSSFGAGVFGRAYSTLAPAFNTPFNYNVANYVDFLPNREYGVYGLVNFPAGKGVYGFNSNLATGFGMYSSGNFAVGPGTKSASVPTSKGNQLVYCKESPEMWFEDFGFGQLQNGSTHIRLDELFLETVFIDASHKMHVVLQEQGESNGLYVIVDADHKGFTVKEKKQGNSNTAFSYSIMAKRRFYQDHRFGVDAQKPFENNLIGIKDLEATTTDPLVMKAYVENARAEKMALYESQKERKLIEPLKEDSKVQILK